MHNILNKYCSEIKVEDNIADKLSETFKNLSVIYSYIIYTKYKSNQLTGWRIEFNISQRDAYNTLDCNIVKEEIYHILTNKTITSTSNVIGYRQPAVEIMLKLYLPLIKRLALQQSNRWTELDYEDAYQMCQLTMLTLYRKNYYIHKRLLERSCNNYVLMSLRHDRDKPATMSIDEVVYEEPDGNSLTIGDMLPDTNAMLGAEAKERQEALDSIFAEVKDIIVELVGERQFEQLLRDYGQKHTTAWSRKKMQQIKEHLKKLGITWKSFNRRY